MILQKGKAQLRVSKCLVCCLQVQEFLLGEENLLQEVARAATATFPRALGRSTFPQSSLEGLEGAAGNVLGMKDNSSQQILEKSPLGVLVHVKDRGLFQQLFLPSMAFWKSFFR